MYRVCMCVTVEEAQPKKPGKPHALVTSDETLSVELSQCMCISNVPVVTIRC